MGHRGHDLQLVETELRARPVPVYPATHHEAEGTQETVPRPASRESLLRRAEKLQVGGGAAIRAL